MSAPLYVKVDEEVVPLSDCNWVLYRSCGCSSGVTVGDLPGLHRQPVTSEALAWREFFGTKREAEQAEKRGARIELMTHTRYCSDVAPTFGRCSHGSPS